MKYMPARVSLISNRFFRAICLTAVLSVGALIAPKVSADTIANWTFETSVPTTSGPYAPEVGSGTASGNHAGSATYSTPAGNGSAHSFSANTWAVGDYWQLTFSTLGTNNIVFAWDQAGSGTGPSQFFAEYSTDGVNFTVVGSTNTMPNTSWTSGAHLTTTSYSVDLSTITSVNNAPVVYVRIVNQSTRSLNGGTTATAGTDRIDNVLVTGTASGGGGGSTGFVSVETQANGGGTVVAAQSLTAGSSVTAYAIQRDATSNFVANIPVNWSIVNRTGSVANGDLVPSGDLMSAVFTGHGVGAANIAASTNTLSSGSSGTLTVTVGTPAMVRVETAANGSGTLVPAENIYVTKSATFYAIRRDAYSNFVDNVAADAWSLPTKTSGVANGDLVAAVDGKSATFTGNGTGTAIVRATSGGLTTVDTGLLNVTTPVPAPVLISQLYGGSGNTGGTYTSDFVELFNRTSTNVNIQGWSVQYASSTGGFTQTTPLPNVSIAPHSYFLLQLAFNVTNAGTAIPTPDYSNTSINMSATVGKVALASITNTLGTVTSLPDGRILDEVGYGAAASVFEGTGPAPGPANSTAIFRNSGGCADTDNNALDFTVAAASPRNSATTPNICPANFPPNITVIPNQSTAVNGSAGPVSFNISDAESDSSNLVVTASSDNPSLIDTSGLQLGGANGVRNITLTPKTGQQGVATISVSVTDEGSLTATANFYLFVGDGPSLGVLLSDNFEAYNDGDLIGFLGDTSAGLWHHHSGHSYDLIASNKVAQISQVLTNSEDVNASLSSPVTVASGATLYLGFTTKQTTMPKTNGDYFIHLKDASTSNFFCKIFASTNNAAVGKYRLGLSNRANNPPNVQFPMDLSLNNTYAVVVRYKVGVASATMWVNSTAATDPSVTATDVSTAFEVDAVALRESGNTGSPSSAGSQGVDNITVSTAFADVLPPLPPKLTAQVAAGNIMLSWPTNNSYNFDLVTNANLLLSSWSLATPAKTIVNTNFVVTNSIAPGLGFYKLQ